MRVKKGRIYRHLDSYYIVINSSLFPDRGVLVKHISNGNTYIVSTSYFKRHFKLVPKLKEILLKGIYESI